MSMIDGEERAQGMKGRIERENQSAETQKKTMKTVKISLRPRTGTLLFPFRLLLLFCLSPARTEQLEPDSASRCPVVPPRYAWADVKKERPLLLQKPTAQRPRPELLLDPWFFLSFFIFFSHFPSLAIHGNQSLPMGWAGGTKSQSKRPVEGVAFLYIVFPTPFRTTRVDCSLSGFRPSSQ